MIVYVCLYAAAYHVLETFFFLCEMTSKSVGGDVVPTIDLCFVSIKVQHPRRQGLLVLSLIVFTSTRKWLNAGVGLRKCLTQDVLRDYLSTTDKRQRETSSTPPRTVLDTSCTYT